MAPLANTYFFLRHGRSLANENDLICSTMENGIKAEYKLSAKGMEQATEAGKVLVKLLEEMPKAPVQFITSPFSRAHETAELVAAAVGIKPKTPQFEVNDDLRERFYGKDLELQKTTGNYAKVFAADEATDGEARPGGDGESANMVAERVRKVIASLEERFKGTIIILSCHGDVCTIGHAAMTPGGSIKTHYKSPLANCELKKLVC